MFFKHGHAHMNSGFLAWLSTAKINQNVINNIHNLTVRVITGAVSQPI